MCCRTIASRERFARDDDCGRGGSEILEEIGEAVEEYEPFLTGRARGEFIVREAHDNEQHGEQGEAHELDGLAAPGVNEEEGCVVAWDETCSGKDEVPDADVLEVDVDGLCALNRRAG